MKKKSSDLRCCVVYVWIVASQRLVLATNFNNVCLNLFLIKIVSTVWCAEIYYQYIVRSRKPEPPLVPAVFTCSMLYMGSLVNKITLSNLGSLDIDELS